MATKAYIGSGKAAQYNSVRVSIKLEDAQRFLKKGENGTWLSFFVAPRKEASEAGNTHSVFVLEQDKAPESAVAEPQGETPVGTTVERNGRKLKRVSKKKAAEIKASQVAEPVELFDGNEQD